MLVLVLGRCFGSAIRDKKGVYLLASPKFLDVSLIFPAPLTGKNKHFFHGQLTVFPETSPNSALVGLPDLDDRLFTAVTDQLTVFAESSPNPLAVFLGYESALLLTDFFSCNFKLRK